MSLKTLLSGAGLVLCTALPAMADGIEVHDAFARTAYPGAPSAAAFMVIHNHGGAPDQLIEARSPFAARVELHTHIDAGDGVMQMRQVEGGFPLPTDGEILMQRGGHHVMLMGVTESLDPGDMVPITLVFQSGQEVALMVEVKADDAAQTDHGTMDHGTMDHGN